MGFVHIGYNDPNLYSGNSRGRLVTLIANAIEEQLAGLTLYHRKISILANELEAHGFFKEMDMPGQVVDVQFRK